MLLKRQVPMNPPFTRNRGKAVPLLEVGFIVWVAWICRTSSKASRIRTRRIQKYHWWWQCSWWQSGFRCSCLISFGYRDQEPGSIVRLINPEYTPISPHRKCFFVGYGSSINLDHDHEVGLGIFRCNVLISCKRDQYIASEDSQPDFVIMV